MIVLFTRSSIPRSLQMLRTPIWWVFACLFFVACSHNQIELQQLSDHAFASRAFKDPLPPGKFISDGCSCWPNSEWLDCCVEHDLSYWYGGSAQERRIADARLRQCVKNKGHQVAGFFMYYGVRIGGVYWLPTSYRWGFGWKYPESGPPGNEY